MDWQGPAHARCPQPRIASVRIVAFVTTAVLVASLLVPQVALAHGLAGKLDLPIPKWLFAWAAAIVLIVSFVTLATLWPTPRLQRASRPRTLTRLPRILDPLCGAIGVALFGVVVYAGLAGEQFDEYSNLTPTFVFVLFWVGIPFLSVTLGDVFRAFNPWRAIARATAWIATHSIIGELPQPIAYPARVGRWPAAAGIIGFAWLELVYVNRTSPSALAYLSLAYAALQLTGMSIYGIQAWTSNADAFSVTFGLYAHISPLVWKRDRLQVRPPLTGLTNIDLRPGTVALLTAMIGSTTFDGFENGALWLRGIEPHLQSLFSAIGAGPDGAIELAGTVGLLGAWLFIAVIYRLAVRGIHTIDPHTPTPMLALRFVHSLVPISFAYVAAHYYSLLLYGTQSAIYLASDPLGNGANLFGTASLQVNYNIVSPDSIWYVQIAAVLLGHCAGLALAHDRSLVLYRRPQDAVRSQYWMLAAMVTFTSLALWLLSAAD